MSEWIYIHIASKPALRDKFTFHRVLFTCVLILSICLSMCLPIPLSIRFSMRLSIIFFLCVSVSFYTSLYISLCVSLYISVQVLLLWMTLTSVLYTAEICVDRSVWTPWEVIAASVTQGSLSTLMAAPVSRTNVCFLVTLFFIFYIAYCFLTLEANK